MTIQEEEPSRKSEFGFSYLGDCDRAANSGIQQKSPIEFINSEMQSMAVTKLD